MNHIVGLLLGLTFLTILIAVAFYVLSKIREGRAKDDAPTAQDLLVKFGQLYDSGILSEEEFRAIKRTFAVELATAPVGKTKKDDGGDAKKSEKDDRAARLERLLRG